MPEFFSPASAECELPGCSLPVEGPRGDGFPAHYCGYKHRRIHKAARGIAAALRAPEGRDIAADAEAVARMWNAAVAHPAARMPNSDHRELRDLCKAYHSWFVGSRHNNSRNT